MDKDCASSKCARRTVSESGKDDVLPLPMLLFENEGTPNSGLSALLSKNLTMNTQLRFFYVPRERRFLPCMMHISISFGQSAIQLKAVSMCE